MAATTSPPLQDATNDSCELAGWIANLTPSEKDRILLRIARDHPATVRTELLRRFHEQEAKPIAKLAKYLRISESRV